MAKKLKQKTSKLKTFVLSLVFLFVGIIVGFVFENYNSLPNSFQIPSTTTSSTSSEPAVAGQIDTSTILSQDLSIHFLELGNKYTGDCVLIKSGDTEILIDAGSKASSVPTIREYLSTYCTDGKLEYVVVTHAHEDHIAGFATSNYSDSVFASYEIGTIIEFAQTNKTYGKDNLYTNYVKNKDTSGATVLSAADCVGQTYSLSNDGNNISFEVLNQKYYYSENKSDAKTENNFSVCLQITENSKKYLFTGDLEEKGEKSLVELNTEKLSHVELYKAGHHGSKTSSSATLMSVITPNIVCVCCCAGSSEYTSKNENQFPTQEFVNNVSIYTNQIYVTSLCTNYNTGEFTSFNGNIVVCSSTGASTQVLCSNSTTVLKDTDWFKQNRTLPANAVS
jgi:beta-lactamase superfamily II metal-dependent hydrolase